MKVEVTKKYQYGKTYVSCELEGDHHGRAPLFVDENTFKEVKDVNAYYDSFPLMD